MVFSWGLMRRKKTSESDMPIGRLTIVTDFLPPPSQLVPREDNVRITLSLSSDSVKFFKKEAKKNKVPYQHMIRSLLDIYSKHKIDGLT